MLAKLARLSLRGIDHRLERPHFSTPHSTVNFALRALADLQQLFDESPYVSEVLQHRVRVELTTKHHVAVEREIAEVGLNADRAPELAHDEHRLRGRAKDAIADPFEAIWRQSPAASPPAAYAKSFSSTTL